VCAAGNEDGPVCFPGTLDTVLTVRASNQWDERKSPKTRDGERTWGSNYGPELDVVAPGVAIPTTDINGARGYAQNNFTGTFNGTSSATPHVAAVAALILSLRTDLKEAQVREAITVSADVINATGAWDKFTGHGRLNAFAALRLAPRV
jgi:thermitase